MENLEINDDDFDDIVIEDTEDDDDAILARLKQKHGIKSQAPKQVRQPQQRPYIPSQQETEISSKYAEDLECIDREFKLGYQLSDIGIKQSGLQFSTGVIQQAFLSLEHQASTMNMMGMSYKTDQDILAWWKNNKNFYHAVYKASIDLLRHLELMSPFLFEHKSPENVGDIFGKVQKIYCRKCPKLTNMEFQELNNKGAWD
jgi:predicted transcriptional regulator